MNRYGCFNTPRRSHYVACGSVVLTDNNTRLTPVPTFIRDTSTTECQYRKTTQDKKCEGCTK